MGLVVSMAIGMGRTVGRRGRSERLGFVYVVVGMEMGGTMGRRERKR